MNSANDYYSIDLYLNLCAIRHHCYRPMSQIVVFKHLTPSYMLSYIPRIIPRLLSLYWRYRVNVKKWNVIRAGLRGMPTDPLTYMFLRLHTQAISARYLSVYRMS